MEAIGIFEGCFSPVHYGHMKIAEELIVLGIVTTVIFVPTGDSYNPKEKTLLPYKHRRQMLELAIKNSKFKNSMLVLDFERNLHKNDKMIYSSATLEYIKSIFPGCAIKYIVGEDNVLRMLKWKDKEKIFEVCQIVSILRAHSYSNDEEEKKKKQEYRSAKQKYWQRYQKEILEVNTGGGYSSTLIRKRLAEGEKDIKELDQEVLRYMLNLKNKEDKKKKIKKFIFLRLLMKIQ